MFFCIYYYYYINQDYRKWSMLLHEKLRYVFHSLLLYFLSHWHSTICHIIQEKFGNAYVNDSSDLTSPKLGLPNVSSQCTTCGSTNIRDCEGILYHMHSIMHWFHLKLILLSSFNKIIPSFLGHFGVIKLPATIYHPHLVNEVVHLLNQICPACKSVKKEIKKDLLIKVSSLRASLDLIYFL